MISVNVAVVLHGRLVIFRVGKPSAVASGVNLLGNVHTRLLEDPKNFQTKVLCC